MGPRETVEAWVEAFNRAEFSRASMVCIVEQVLQEGDWAVLEYWDKLSFLRLHGLPIPPK